MVDVTRSLKWIPLALSFAMVTLSVLPVADAQLDKAPPWYDAGIPWWLRYPGKSNTKKFYSRDKANGLAMTDTVPLDTEHVLMHAGR